MLYRENGQFKSTYAEDQQILPIVQDRWFMLALLAVAYFVLPAVATDYTFRALIIPFLILAIAAIGLNILVGYCGQISLGTAAFMAIGAYAAYNLVVRVPMLNFLIVLMIAVVLTIAAKNLVRGHIGRSWMAMRDMDVAAEVIGIRPLYAKLSAFAVSSFYAGVAGALWGFVHLGAWEPLAFNINMSLNLLFMIIIGGMGSLLGAYFGAAFIVLLPILLNQIPGWFGIPISTAFASHLELMIFGSLIVFFLIAEPHGLARLWTIGKEKLRLWPFPH